MGAEMGPAVTVLVTGGTGFLGGWCVAELLERGYAVRTTVRDASREAEVRATLEGQVDAGDRSTSWSPTSAPTPAGRRPSPAATASCTSPRRSRPSSRRTPTS